MLIITLMWGKNDGAVAQIKNGQRRRHNLQTPNSQTPTVAICILKGFRTALAKVSESECCLVCIRRKLAEGY